MNSNFKAHNIPDPSEFEGSTKLSLFDKKNPDIQFLNLVDEENIRLSGSKILYFVYAASKEYDDVYMEQRNKPINTNAIEVFAHYDPRSIEENLTQFGIELVNDQVFTFNKAYITKKLGRSPIPGDQVQPLFQKIRYEIKEVQEDSFEVYGAFHYICSATILRDYIDNQNNALTKLSDEIGGIGERNELL